MKKSYCKNCKDEELITYCKKCGCLYFVDSKDTRTELPFTLKQLNKFIQQHEK